MTSSAVADDADESSRMAHHTLPTLSAYVHIPFCASRCGYCDFNTYTASELQRDGTTVSVATYAQRVIREIELNAHSADSLFAPVSRPLSTVFFGGGTPTLLSADDLVSILGGLKDTFGFLPDAEVTTEANPDSVDKKYLEILRDGGFTRISFGHQSSSPQVLKVLDRTHTAGRTWDAVRWAREVGFEHVSVDLIYASPLETEDDLKLTLDEIGQADLDHVSAYSLIVEQGTRLAHQIARKELPSPSDDVAAVRYEFIDQALTELGMTWYEVSNWAKPHGECQHNIAYWRNQDWLGIGPGAHAHHRGVRTWNVKHPALWASHIDSDTLPEADREQLAQSDIRHENIMLGLRLREGLSLHHLSPSGQAQAQEAAREGLLDPDAFAAGTAMLTFKGRLLADGLVTRLWD